MLITLQQHRMGRQFLDEVRAGMRVGYVVFPTV